MHLTTPGGDEVPHLVAVHQPESRPDGPQGTWLYFMTTRKPQHTKVAVVVAAVAAAVGVVGVEGLVRWKLLAMVNAWI